MALLRQKEKLFGTDSFFWRLLAVDDLALAVRGCHSEDIRGKKDWGDLSQGSTHKGREYLMVGIIFFLGVLLLIGGMAFRSRLPKKGSSLWEVVTAGLLVLGFVIYFYSVGLGVLDFSIPMFLILFAPPTILAGIAGYRGHKGYFVFSTVSLLVGLALIDNLLKRYMSRAGSGAHIIHVFIIFMFIAGASVLIGLFGLLFDDREEG
jgi:hypothetical protein